MQSIAIFQAARLVRRGAWCEPRSWGSLLSSGCPGAVTPISYALGVSLPALQMRLALP